MRFGWKTALTSLLSVSLGWATANADSTAMYRVSDSSHASGDAATVPADCCVEADACCPSDTYVEVANGDLSVIVGHCHEWVPTIDYEETIFGHDAVLTY